MTPRSYSQILRSSAITGGSAALGMLLGMISVKAAAYFLGPSGVGELRIYQSLLLTIGTVTGLGMGSGAIREFAIAHSQGNEEQMANLDVAIRRVASVTASASWLITVCLAVPLSFFAFGSSANAKVLAILGTTFLITGPSFTYNARLAGRRRIGDMAKASMASAALSTAFSVGCYALLGKDGIAPAMILGAVAALLAARYYARGSAPAYRPSQRPSWAESAALIRPMIGISVAIMTGSLAPSVIGVGIGAMLIRELGPDSNGLYWAAWGLSGISVNFVLGTMGADYFPRISASAHDPSETNRLVNEQIEVGVLLATPGLVAISVLSPLAIWLLYSERFLGAEHLVAWFCVGLLINVICWPVSYLYAARKAARLYVALQGFSVLQQLALSYAGLKMFGLRGIAIGFVAHLVLLMLIERLVVYPRFSVRWNNATVQLVLQSLGLVSASLALVELLPSVVAIPLGCLLAGLSAIFSVRGLQHRLGPEHRVFSILRRIPLASWVMSRGTQSMGTR
jgi:antigen flippase